MHAAPLGKDETEATRKNMNWKYGEFEIPEAVQKAMDCTAKGAELQAEWKKVESAYAAKYPEDYAEYQSITTGKLPEGWADSLPTFTPEDKGVATRIHSQTALTLWWCSGLLAVLPICPSNMTLMTSKDTREHGVEWRREHNGGYR